MNYSNKPLPAKLLISVFTQQTQLFDTIIKILIKKFGPVDFQSHLLDFNQTNYYENEFGPNLKRIFISFRKLIRPEHLWKIKCQTNALEKKFSQKGKRSVNIDPGYLTQASLILASTKNFSHRIYLQKGIYAEVTLLYHTKHFITLPWTYPDYQTAESLELFTMLRAKLKEQLKHFQ